MLSLLFKNCFLYQGFFSVSYFSDVILICTLLHKLLGIILLCLILIIVIRIPTSTHCFFPLTFCSMVLNLQTIVVLFDFFSCHHWIIVFSVLLIIYHTTIYCLWGSLACPIMLTKVFILRSFQILLEFKSIRHITSIWRLENNEKNVSFFPIFCHVFLLFIKLTFLNIFPKSIMDQNNSLKTRENDIPLW